MNIAHRENQLTSEERLSRAIELTTLEYVDRNPKSRLQYEQACKWMPGGSTRSTLFYTPFPLTIARGDGPYLWDVDKHRYLNLVGEYSAGLYGHDRDLLKNVLGEIESRGMLLSGPNEYEARLAEVICKRFPSCDLVRFSNSGTEANLMALGIARNATGRKAVMVFKNAYHGGVLVFGDEAGPLNIELDTVMATFNNYQGTLDLIRKHGNRLGAILIEPMMGAGGCIPADKAFLNMLREEATRYGIILIFDEVMTSRLSPGGLQEKMGVVPDMTTFGKYMGGGFSFGAFGGRSDLMGLLNDRNRGCIPHSGTFNNNIASMVAGYIGLTERLTPEANLALNTLGDSLRNRMNAIAEKHEVPVRINGMGSVMSLHISHKVLRQPQDPISPHSDSIKEFIHLHFLNQGMYMARRGLITVNMQLDEGHINEFLELYEETVAGKLKDLIPTF